MKTKAQTKISSPSVQPYISAGTILPEMTVKGVLLGIFLAIVLAGSNAYLGLKMGQTISASIPAAVISMTVLRMFRRSNILENNIVQTIASAGEVAAAGVVFTIPALVVMGYWHEFHYWQITLIAVVGSVLGILFTVPLRRALVVDGDLKFPEGVATAEVLKAGDGKDSAGVKDLIFGASAAALIKFSQSGLQILGENVKAWYSVGGAIFGFSNGLSLAMLGAGYIVGLKVAINLLVGAIIAWVIAVPLYSMMGTPQDYGLTADASAFDFAMAIRSQKIRFIGVGVLTVGGLWALISLIQPIRSAVLSSFDALRKARLGHAVQITRTEKDIPMTLVLLLVGAAMIPVFMIFNYVMEAAHLPITSGLYWASLSFLTVFALFVGFICASIGGYMAGIVGSSCNPISGITIAAILVVSLSLLMILKTEIDFKSNPDIVTTVAAMVIIIGSIVAVIAAFSCDNLQDLKAGHLLGSTPWKQQITLIIGGIAGALVVAPILQLLYEAYGVGGVFPREGMDLTQALTAPQATLMASVALGIFAQTLDWPLVILGVGIGVITILIDQFILKRSNSDFRLSVLTVTLGVYLPMDVVLPLIIGGIISFFAHRKITTKKAGLGSKYPAAVAKAERRGLLTASGLIAGDALIGILLAIPFAAYQSTSVLALVGPAFAETATVLGTLAFAGVGYYLYKLGAGAKVKLVS